MADRSNQINYVMKAIVFRAVCVELRELYGYELDTHREVLLLGVMGLLDKRQDYRKFRGLMIALKRNGMPAGMGWVKLTCEKFVKSGYVTHYMDGKQDAYKITERGKAVLDDIHNLVNDNKVRFGRSLEVMPAKRKHRVPRF